MGILDKFKKTGTATDTGAMGNSLAQVQADPLASALAAKLSLLINEVGRLSCATAAKRIALNLIVPQMAALTLGTFNRQTQLQEKGELHDRLNYGLFGNLTGFEGWLAVFNNLLSQNNAVCRINRLGRKFISLEPLLPSRYTCVVAGAERAYTVDGTSVEASDVWHLKLNTYDGLIGVDYESEVNAFKLAEEAENMAKRFFDQGGNIGRIWKLLAGSASVGQEKAVQEFINLVISGKLNQHRDVVVPALVEKVDAIQGTSPRDGQMLESREFDSKNILALYGVDLARLNLELIYNVTIVPVLENIEQSIAKFLLTPDDRAAYKVKYIEAGRFRGDVKSQYENASNALKFQTVNEVRGWFGLPALGAEYDAIVNPNTASAGVNETRTALAQNASA